MHKTLMRKLAACIVILVLIQQSTSQNPEIHQAAGITRFTGIYSFLGSYIAIREAYFLASLVCVLVAGNVFLTFFQLPSYFLPIHHNQKRSLSWSLEDAIQYLTYLYYFLEMIEGNPNMKKYREVLSIPSPHPEEHPGLAYFTPYSVIPMLRFYSFTFRFFILSATALFLLFRPIMILIRREGLRAPGIFQNVTGVVASAFRPMRRRRQIQPTNLQLEPDDQQVSILSNTSNLPSRLTNDTLRFFNE